MFEISFFFVYICDNFFVIFPKIEAAQNIHLKQKNVKKHVRHVKWKKKISGDG